jgi:DNA-binding NtrC family response regulator
MPQLLVVDDNVKVAESLVKVLASAGYICSCASDTAGAMDVVRKGDVDVVLLDIMLGKEDGMDCLQLIREEDPTLPVIMITGFATIDNAVRSMKQGAHDFIQKPLDVRHLLKILENAVKIKTLEIENRNLRERMEGLSPRPATESPAMRDLLLHASRVAATELPVLIRGENGTGKELLADYIHARSSRSAKPILKINCAAFPESLLDNELFGHERGAYTGATAAFRGIFERANGGTLFLDEVGDMPQPIQAKILRVLQNSEVRRIGGSETLRIDVRFITATNKDLELLMSREDFRQDLYFRLNAVTLMVPPLRDRPEDIPVLAQLFVDEFNESTKCIAKSVSPAVFGAFLEHPWPGNVRELKNAVMYACSMASSPMIGPADLPPTFSSARKPGADPMRFDSKYGRDPRSEAEADVIKRILEQCGHNKKRAAERLNMSRNTLYRKIAHYGIPEGPRE